jgi:transposase
MKDTDLFQLAMGLTSPWRVMQCAFDKEQGRLDISIDFARGGTFPCPECGRAACKAYDTEERTWRHLNFFQYKTYLHARVPRVQCETCGIKVVNVPWARTGSGFTLLFEALIMTLAAQMPVQALARIVNEHDTRLWRVLVHYVAAARAKADYSAVTQVGVDETASRRGQNYVSLFVDLERSQVLFATEGKDAATVGAFKEDLVAHGGAAAAIGEVCCDMSPAFISGAEEHFPQAHLTFDKFHVLKIINEAVDEVRRQERQSRPELTKTRYLWLKNPENLTVRQVATIERLSMKKFKLKTARAYHLRLVFQEFWGQAKEEAETFLRRWYSWAVRSGLAPMREAAATIKRHWSGILRWFESRVSNGVLEGINSLVQAAKSRARGYRTARNFITMIYLIAGKLDFNLPT